PKIPKPGNANTSTARHATPPINNMISSQSAVPCKNFAQKNNMKQTTAMKPGTVAPGVDSSKSKANPPTNNSKLAIRGSASHSTNVSTRFGRVGLRSPSIWNDDF